MVLKEVDQEDVQKKKEKKSKDVYKKRTIPEALGKENIKPTNEIVEKEEEELLENTR